MKDLIIFEFKKIIRKKLNIVVLIGSLILTAILFIAPVVQFIAFDKNGVQEKGFTAIELQKHIQGELQGTLTNERISDDILEYQGLFDISDNVIINDGKKELSDLTFSKYVAPKIYYLGFINNTYTLPNVYDYSFAEIKRLSIEDSIGFYEQREKKVLDILNADYKDWNYSKQEKKFWLKKNSKISSPYEYGYYEGWKAILECIELMAIPIIAICICIAPIFSGEYQSGADNIILSSKYGKSKLILAKILVSFIFSSVVYTINICLGLGIILLSFGVNGGSLPIQIMSSTIPYPLTFLSATIICIITVYLVMFSMISITLLLSAKVSNPFPVLISIICVMIIPLFLKLSETNGVWNHIFMLFPSVSCQSVFLLDATNYLSYPFGPITMDIITMRIIIYSVVSIICIPFAYNTFKKHQVI